MHSKAQLIAMLREEFNRWEELFAQISADQITTPNFIGRRSIKDIVAHLTVWQQLSVARLEAGLQNREPAYPDWPPELDRDAQEDVDGINEWALERYRAEPWSALHLEWENRFLNFLELAEAVPENELMEVGRYAWLPDYALSAVLAGSLEHHQEHREPILLLLKMNG